MVTINNTDLLTLEPCTVCGAPTGFDWFGKPVLCLTCETARYPAKNNEFEKAVSIVIFMQLMGRDFVSQEYGSAF